MTDPNENLNTDLFLPITLAILFVLVVAALLWVTQISPVVAPGVVESTTADTGAAAPAQASSGDPAAGQELFTGTCSACHGPTGEGLPGLGKDMTTSEFIAGNTDDELVNFIKVGRDPSDPLNTTGVGMPVKGGNPALSDEDLYDIIAYIRTIHK